MQLTATLLLATIAAAAPSRLSRRASPFSQPPQFVDGDFAAESNVTSDSTNVVTTSNWAGGQIAQPPSGTFTTVSGQFTIPKAKVPAGKPGNKEYSAAFWVGIGSSDILQTGIDSTILANGQHQVTAWYEWFPEGSGSLTGLDLAVGDKMELSVHTAGTGSTGTVTIKNLSKNKSASKTLQPPSGQKPGDQTAEWIVEDYTVGNGMIAFADWGSVEFTQCSAKTTTGKTVGPKTGREIDIVQDNKTLAKASIGAGTVTVKYTG